MNIFQEVKEHLTMKDVVELYGFTVNRSGFCSCPLHNEKTPSMKIYEKGFKCFGCGEGGDLIYFVQKYFDMSPVDACKKLNSDFKLYIDEHARTDKPKYSEYIQMKQRNDTLKDKENCALNIVSDYLSNIIGIAPMPFCIVRSLHLIENAYYRFFHICIVSFFFLTRQ